MSKGKGYHIADITKGVLGEFSKIKEEFLEADDANAQGSKVMVLVELSDLLGAIENYIQTNHNMEIYDLKKFSDITKRAFKSGMR